MRTDYMIDVLNWNEQTWKRPDGGKALLRLGIPPKVVLRWKKVRREMTQKGLTRKVALLRN